MPGQRSSALERGRPVARAETAAPARTVWVTRAVDGIHLLALSGLALAQPIFNLLGKNAEFFAVRDSSRAQIVGFALLLVFVPPLALWLVELAVGVLSEPVRRVVHILFVAGLLALIAAQALRKATGLSTTPFIVAVVVAAAIVTAAYFSFAAVRSLATFLGAAPIVFLVLFLFASSVTKLVLPAKASVQLARVGSKTPVVLIVFDEFPITSLMDENEKIDAVRYPNFARLQSGGTWYRSNTTVDTGTTRAVPAILTGIYPKSGLLPTFADHPRNVFTLLGRKYRLNVWETETHLCPPRLCTKKFSATDNTLDSLFSDVGIVYLHLIAPKDEEHRLPDVTTTWGNFGAGGQKSAGNSETGRVDLFRRFLTSIHDSTRPALNMIHVTLPHGDWIFLPSCHRYGVTQPVAPGRGKEARWTGPPWQVVQAYQRHLAQTECTDRLLGELLARLHKTRLYDKSLLIVLADHGVSIRRGQLSRKVDPRHPTNLQDIVFPPLFVKYPNQRVAKVVKGHTQTIDVVPTIADVLGVRIPWHVDGKSLRRGGHPPRLHLLTKSTKVVRRPLPALLARRAALLRRQVRLFGFGTQPPGLWGIGPDRKLLGRSVSAFRVAPAQAKARYESATVKRLRRLPAHPQIVPDPVIATVKGAGAAAGKPVAVAVNGQIVAMTKTVRSFGSIQFEALVPEDAYHAGRNKVEAFWVTGSPGAPVLQRLGRA